MAQGPQSPTNGFPIPRPVPWWVTPENRDSFHLFDTAGMYSPTWNPEIIGYPGFTKDIRSSLPSVPGGGATIKMEPQELLWTKVQQLQGDAMRQMQSVYGVHFPIEVRHFFANWIETRNWSEINEDDETHEQFALSLRDELLQMLEEKAQELSTEDMFLTKLKLQETVQQFKEIYGNNPMNLVRVVKNCLATETRLVQQAESSSRRAANRIAKTLPLAVLTKTAAMEGGFGGSFGTKKEPKAAHTIPQASTTKRKTKTKSAIGDAGAPGGNVNSGQAPLLLPQSPLSDSETEMASQLGTEKVPFSTPPKSKRRQGDDGGDTAGQEPPLPPPSQPGTEDVSFPTPPKSKRRQGDDGGDTAGQAPPAPPPSQPGTEESSKKKRPGDDGGDNAGQPPPATPTISTWDKRACKMYGHSLIEQCWFDNPSVSCSYATPQKARASTSFIFAKATRLTNIIDQTKEDMWGIKAAISDLRSRRQPSLHHLTEAQAVINKGLKSVKDGLEEIREETRCTKERVERMGKCIDEMHTQSAIQGVSQELEWSMEVPENWQ